MTDLMKTRASRFSKSFDAASQFVNVTLLRRHRDTNANESTSGRCHWEAHYGKNAGHWTWVYAERVIDFVFRVLASLRITRKSDVGHCEEADYIDYLRAKEKVRRYEARQPQV